MIVVLPIGQKSRRELQQKNKVNKEETKGVSKDIKSE